MSPKEKKEVTPKTIRQRKYRDKIKTNNASKYEEMKRKIEKERKQAEREIDREKGVNDSRKLSKDKILKLELI